MDTAPVLRIFRMVAPEFRDIKDKQVKEWMELCSPLVSQRRFGRLHDKALAFLTAHRMKMAAVGVEQRDDPLHDIGNISMGNLMRVGSLSEGSVSVGFNTNTAQFADVGAEYALTVYGVQFNNLKRMLMSITSAGEGVGRV